MADKARKPKEPAKPDPAPVATKPIAGVVTDPEAKGRIKGVYGTLYYVADMKTAGAFYARFLGAKPRFESPEWTEFPVGASALCLHKAAENKASNGTLILAVTELKALVAELKAAGRQVTEPKEVHPGAWSAEFKDKDGNTLSLYEG